MTFPLRLACCFNLAFTACGPDAPIDTLSVAVTVVDGQVTFNWTGGSGTSAVRAEVAAGAPVGTLAVYPCDECACPPGAYRDEVTESPYWYVTREDYSECTFPQLSGPVKYGEAPPFLSAQRSPEVGPAPLRAGKRFVVVVFHYQGCLSGGPLEAGRAEFTAP